MGCYNTAVIPAPIDEVWAAIHDFHDLRWSAKVIETVEVVGDKSGDQIGAKRVLNNAFHETLLAIDEVERTFAYAIDEGPGPLRRGAVTGYVGKVRVRPVTMDNATFVEWSSIWESSSGGVAEFCNPIYQALLSDLKAHFRK